MSCASLKDCIIFDNGAIDTRMSAARNSWDVFNEKFGLRKKLLQILVEDIIPPMDQVILCKSDICFWVLVSNVNTKIMINK